MKATSLMLVVLASLFCCVRDARADCHALHGDVGIERTDAEFWYTSPSSGYSEHVHDFDARCDAADLPSYTGEVSIMIAVSADLEGSTKYVTANFVSGTETTAITSGNGFVGAPSDGQFFKTTGTTACAGEMDKAVVTLDYDDFNALLAAGDGTMMIEVVASAAVEDVCSICCEDEHSWTPDECCDDEPACSCPPGVESKTEVTLVYLDCKIIGDDCCVTNADCEDEETGDGLFCNGEAECVDCVCVQPGNPCGAQTCDEAADVCRDCDYWGDPTTNDQHCRDTEGLYCTGDETCNEGTGLCEDATDRCPGDCFEAIDSCLDCD